MEAPFGYESLIKAAEHEFLVHARLKASAATILFLPGGGHLARVAYGHPGTRQQDFLDHQLEARDLGLLAISYPNSHQVFTKAYPMMTLSQWAEGVAEIATDLVDGGPLLIAGWSMGGKGVLRLNRALEERGATVTGFVALSARPPWPGLSPRSPGGELLHEDGLWDYSRYNAIAISGLEEVNRLAGYQVISPDEHRLYYRGAGPLMLRGEVDRIGPDGRFTSLDAALNDSEGFAFDQAPLCATISPTYPTDADHALAGAATWSAIGLMGLIRNHLAGIDLNRLPPDTWSRLRALAADWTQTMNRTVEGGHYFFIGETGAAVTADALADLYDQLAAVGAELHAIKVAALAN
ncbi:thioesterase domain-containing protein [Rhodococcus koreensis]|uniref:thioesterase domain-containing protein n=1 Tax=Rhodococcus koreensis TaxID=99653 RepID=UPI00366CD429